MSERIVVVEITRMEIVHLAALVTQFSDLLATSADAAGRATDDPAVARLVPDAYPDDAEAADDFRSVTETDLLGRRAHDAQVVLATLGEHPETPSDAAEVLSLALGGDEVAAWLRTLAALRLVLATRLGIQDDDDHDEDDPRFGIYDWVGYRLDGLVRALED